MKKSAFIRHLKKGKAISKWANHVMSIHVVKKEWRVAILTLAAAKLLTMCTSAYAGYFFFIDYYQPVIISSIGTVLLSLFSLYLLELLTAVFLEKTFKFLFLRRFLISFLTLLAVSGFYTLSFVSSTSGLAKKQAEKGDQSEWIISESRNKIRLEKEHTDDLIRDIKERISLIEANPQGWSNGKRQYLTSLQLKNISILNDKKDDLRINYSNMLSRIAFDTKSKMVENSTLKSNTAKQYYMFMTIIMIAQFIITGILVFFLHLIRLEDESEKSINEKLPELENLLEEFTCSVSSDKINEFANEFNKLSKANSDHSTKQNSPPTLNDTQSKLELLIRTLKVLKYKNNKSTFEKSKAAQNFDDRVTYLTSKNIKYLQKHINIVKAIKSTIPPPLKTISNNQIAEIQRKAKNAEHKSYTLVRNVFEVCRLVGIENINLEGEIASVKSNNHGKSNYFFSIKNTSQKSKKNNPII